MELGILTDIVIILGLSVIVIYFFQLLKVPTILGFLITGIIAGPYGLSWIHGVHEVEIMAEIGVILLLFVIGIEFSLKSLAAIKKFVLVGGGIQVVLTVLITVLIATLFNYSLQKAIFLGFLFSLSSTAVVLKLLQDRGEMNSPHGKGILAVLIFQDIIVVPMMLFIPLLAGQSENIWESILMMSLKGVLVIFGVLLSARYVIPPLLYRIAKTRSNELFMIVIIVICFAVAWGTSSIGLSLSLGAFLAGLTISESEYSHHAMAYVVPFKEIFTSFFFVSVGMLLDLNFLVQNIGIILLLTLAAIILKSAIGFIAAKSLRFPLRNVIIIGFSIAQIGEFSFILADSGQAVGLIGSDIYQYFLSISILAIAATPFITQAAHRLSDVAIRKSDAEKQVIQPEEISDHIVIIGFGLNGRNLATAAKKFNIPYKVVEMNPDTVKQEKHHHPIIYGDAVQASLLHHLNIHKARVAVIAISDPKSTRLIIKSIRSISQHVHIVVRTRFIQEMEELYHIGADEVIPEEFETAIEIFHRVLNHYLVPQNEIDKSVHQIRSDNYDMFRMPSESRDAVKNYGIHLSKQDIVTLPVEKSAGKIVGKKLSESNVRKVFNINILAIKKNGEYIYDVTGDTIIHQEDILYVLGSIEDIKEFEAELRI